MRILVAGLVAAVSTLAFAIQKDAEPTPELKPYPGSVRFCSESVTGAPQPDGTPGMHITWVAYHTTTPLEQVKAHYLLTLGKTNHATEGKEETWRFPRDTPVRVLSVSPTPARVPSQRCAPPPASARTVMIISSAARP
jgi:hypothetical protein